MSGDGGILPIVPVIGGSGPQNQTFFPLSLALGAEGPRRARHRGAESEAADRPKTYIVGAPQLTFTYSGLGTSRNVYAQLVDTRPAWSRQHRQPGAGEPGRQDPRWTVSMEDIAYTMDPGTR